MRIILATLIIFILQIYDIRAQCPSSLFFSTQSAVDNFSTIYPSCTNMEGNILVIGNDISNLNGLAQLTSIVGNISFSNMNQLSSLSGLENLETLEGTLSLSQIFALSDISALGNLTNIGQDLNIVFTALTDLSGLENITHIGGTLVIGSNSQLITIQALANLTMAQGVAISNNDLLPNLIGLEGITSLDGSLGISNNDLLTNLSELAGITSVGGELSINDNINLIDFSGLENLTKVGSAVRIDDNERIKNFTGLNSLDSIGWFIDIRNNDSLLNFQGLNSLEYIASSLQVFDNDALVNFSGLNALSQVTQQFFIVNNGQLTNLSGIENFTLAPQLYAIVNNPMLNDISAISALDENTTSNLLLRDNASLAICDSPLICDYLDSGGNATIENNLFGCNSISEVIADCNGTLPVELIQFEGTLIDENKTKLFWQTASEVNNQGFGIEWKQENSNWKKIGWTEGQGTSSKLNNYFFIHNTPLSGENYYRLKQIDMDGKFEYSPIIEVNIKETTSFDLFPNPATTTITIESQIPELRANLYNSTGKLLRVIDITTINHSLGISDLRPGLYFIEYKENGHSKMKRFVKM